MKQILIGLSLGAVFMCGWIAIFAQSGAQVNPPKAAPANRLSGNPMEFGEAKSGDILVVEADGIARPMSVADYEKKYGLKILWVNEGRVKKSTVTQQYLPFVMTAWFGTNETDVECGLRDDGVVVWRKVKTAQ